jgi:hypothetical protein
MNFDLGLKYVGGLMARRSRQARKSFIRPRNSAIDTSYITPSGAGYLDISNRPE